VTLDSSFPWRYLIPLPPISTNTGSDEAVYRVRHWLEECVNEHENCARSSPKPLPTRVLQLDGPEKVKLRITNQDMGSYACLSHCWGREPLIQTTSSTLERFQVGIPWAQLPRTFRDAVSFAHRLGLQYLWIDSLCILQDSTEDWRREGSAMARIYQNSYITLSATRASDASSGCFVDADARYISRTMTFQNSNNEPYSIHTRQKLKHAQDPRPLQARGWVFQERMLSPRIVHFLSQELMWECCTGTTCECSESWELGGTKENINTQLRDNASMHDIQKHWGYLVSQYTAKALTFQADIFPALQGLAKLVSPSMGRYLAGHWENTLVQSLSWHLSGAGYCRPREWRAPTWSWASTTGAIEWQPPGTSKVTLLSATTMPKGLDPTGELASGELVLRGRGVTGSIVHHDGKDRYGFVSNAAVRFEHAGEAFESTRHVGYEVKQVWWDYSVEDEDEGPHCVPAGAPVLVMKLDESINRYVRTWLVLRPVKGRSHVYERICLFKFLQNPDEDPRLPRDDERDVFIDRLEALYNGAAKEITVTVI
jgi:hypothetical protein